MGGHARCGTSQPPATSKAQERAQRQHRQRTFVSVLAVSTPCANTATLASVAELMLPSTPRLSTMPFTTCESCTPPPAGAKHPGQSSRMGQAGGCDAPVAQAAQAGMVAHGRAVGFCVLESKRGHVQAHTATLRTRLHGCAPRPPHR